MPVSSDPATPSENPSGFFHEYGRRVHGAQVIVEGREEQSDGGEKNKDNQHNPKAKQTTAHRPSLHHHVVFSLLGETIETKTND